MSELTLIVDRVAAVRQRVREVAGANPVTLMAVTKFRSREEAMAAIEAGVEPLEAAKSVDLGEFAGWHDPERIVGNLYRAMAELTGTPPGGPVDVVAAFGAMISYHGGPLACFA